MRSLLEASFEAKRSTHHHHPDTIHNIITYEEKKEETKKCNIDFLCTCCEYCTRCICNKAAVHIIRRRSCETYDAQHHRVNKWWCLLPSLPRQINATDESCLLQRGTLSHSARQRSHAIPASSRHRYSLTALDMDTATVNPHVSTIAL